jgi:tRNA-modifying protein YgfZ
MNPSVSLPATQLATEPASLSASDSALPSGVARLAHLGVIRAQGPDAASFLHNQLTQDFTLLGLHEARLAALCNAKGRMLASFIGFKRSAEDIWLVCSHDLLAPTLKRLQMFVLRAKVQLSDASEALALYGVTGIAIKNIAARADSTWARADFDTQIWVQLYPAAGVPRALVAQPLDAPPPAGEALSPALWHWSEVQSGVATLSLPVVEAFVPQMLNYESVGGVNFKKGCYPGQEVVARSQFRGSLKRRATRLHSAEPLHAGQAVYHSQDPEQACGTIAQAAPHPSGGFEAIASVLIASLQSGSLHAGSASGALLTPLGLPYALLEDV